MRRTGLALSLALASSLTAASAGAQQPAPPPDAPVAPPAQPPPVAPAEQPAQPGAMQPAAPPGYPQQPPPGYGQPPPGYPQPGYGPGYPQPGYGPQGYGYPQYGYAPPPGPSPPPPVPKGRGCCRWSARFNPLELLYRRLTFEAEVAVIGPLTLGVSPSWIFGSPYENIDTKGFTIAGDVTVYLFGKPMSGIFLKGHFAYENFSATLTNPQSEDLVSAPQQFQSAVLGGMFGSTEVFGKNGGFALSGGIGVGVATHGTVTLRAPGNPAIGIPAYEANLYDKFDKIRLLGSLSLGVAF